MQRRLAWVLAVRPGPQPLRTVVVEEEGQAAGARGGKGQGLKQMKFST